MSQEPITEATIRHTIVAALDEFMYRLEVRFVTREEFRAVQEEGRDNTTAIALLERTMGELARKLDGIAAIIARVGWAIVLAVLAAVLATVLR